MKMKRDLEFLYEIGTLRFIQRSWSRFLSPNFANLSEHHFRVAWLALIIAEKEKNVNLEKLLKIALLHDIAESRVGDVDYLSRQYVERNEDLGLADMVKETVLEKEMTKLWQDYKKKKSFEAKIVKDADNLDVDLEIKEQEIQGNQISKILGTHRKSVVKSRLYTKTAKKLLDAIQTSNPHDWHRRGRNRVNDGDWKAIKTD